MLIAVADHAPVRGDTTANLATIARLAAGAAAAKASLLVLPRLSLTGVPATEQEAGRVAELSDGASAHALREIAARHEVGLAAGYVEACTGRCYDAALVIDAAGRCLANYRCSHLDRVAAHGLSQGQWLTVVPIGSLRCGVLIGPDIAYPEPARALALAGVDALAVLGDATADAAVVPDILVPARAAENGVGVIYAGSGARIAAADGTLTGRAVGEGLIVAELAGASPALGPAFAPFAGRRQRLYQRLVAVEEGETGPPI
ncbi:MAG: nitrilase-related carbon-nitrogen hydrolase [Geminicoccaceae bacterium]